MLLRLVAATVLTRLALSAGEQSLRSALPIRGPRHIVALGDSFTADGRYLNQVLAMLPEGSTVRKYGHVGKGVAFLLQQLPLALSGTVTDLIVLGGVNDLASGRSLSSIQKALAEIYEQARAAGKRVIAVTIPPWAGYLNQPRFAGKKPEILKKWVALNHWIEQQARDGLVVVKTNGMGNQAGELLAQFASADKLHPSTAGQMRLGQVIGEQAFS